MVPPMSGALPELARMCSYPSPSRVAPRSPASPCRSGAGPPPSARGDVADGLPSRSNSKRPRRRGPRSALFLRRKHGLAPPRGGARSALSQCRPFACPHPPRAGWAHAALRCHLTTPSPRARGGWTARTPARRAPRRTSPPRARGVDASPPSSALIPSAPRPRARAGWTSRLPEAGARRTSARPRARGWRGVGSFRKRRCSSKSSPPRAGWTFNPSVGAAFSPTEARFPRARGGPIGLAPGFDAHGSPPARGVGAQLPTARPGAPALAPRAGAAPARHPVGAEDLDQGLAPRAGAAPSPI